MKQNEHTLKILNELKETFQEFHDNDHATAAQVALSSITCIPSKTEELRSTAKNYIIRKQCWKDAMAEISNIISRLEELECTE